VSAEKSRQRTFALVTVLLVPLVAFLAAEAGVRLLGLEPESLGFPRYMTKVNGEWIEEGTWARGHIKRPSPYPGIEMGEYVPGTEFTIFYPSNPRGYFDDDGGVPVRVNTIGLRGEETTWEKPEGTLRLLGLGDSFTFGGPWEALNAGVGGYNTRDEVLVLERRWLRLDPDVVLIGFYLNDAYRDVTFLTPEEAQAYETKGFARVSRLWDLLSFRLWQYRLQKHVEQFYRSHYFAEAGDFLENAGGEGKVVDWSVSRAALARARDLGDKHGFRVALVLFPSLYGLDGDYPFADIHRIVTDACREMGIPALDLLETFRGRKAADLWVHLRDHHPNEIAHGIIADEIARFLTDPAQGVVPPNP
jgi:hypothetical protein